MAPRSLLIVSAVLAALVVGFAQFPLTLALSLLNAPGLSADAARGTLWSGSLYGAALAGFDIGEVNLRTSLGRLMTGEPPVVMRWRSAIASGKARAAIGRDGFGLNAVELRMAFETPQLRGIADLSNASISFAADGCTSAAGDIVVTPANGGAPLSGSLACQGGGLMARLQANGLVLEIPIVNGP
ncbi:MAG: type II secretion system protein N [Pseudomonadota bacterium]